jgi:putative holliday junction resolvase
VEGRRDSRGKWAGTSRVSGRVLGVDFGSKRIGIAISDFTGVLASPLTVLERTGDVKRDHKRIADLVSEEEAVTVVVGLPVDLEGKNGIAAQHVAGETARLATVLDVPVVTYDERMTTATASRQLADLGVSSKKRRTTIDKFAAAMILQGYLDSRRGAQ